MPADPRPRTQPFQLWQQAKSEFPNDETARRIRYIALMREYGHIVPTLDGKPRTTDIFGHEREGGA